MNLDTSIEITFEAVCWESRPKIRWNWKNFSHEQTLFGTSTVGFSVPHEEGDHIIRFEFFNKTNEDTQDGKDKAIIIRDVKINSISDPKILLATKYKPNYPEPWLSQQTSKPDPVLFGQDYLGWNGTWELEYSVPAFQWLHKTLDLGQQY